MMTDYIRREVEFRAKVTETSTCTCAACHNVGRVVKLKLSRNSPADHHVGGNANGRAPDRRREV